MSVNRRIDPQILIFPYNRILLRIKKEQTTDVQNMDKSKIFYGE